MHYTHTTRAARAVMRLRGAPNLTADVLADKRAAVLCRRSERVTFELRARDLAIFDDDPAVDAWRIVQGDYVVQIGASSRDIRAQASFAVDAASQ